MLIIHYSDLHLVESGLLDGKIDTRRNFQASLEYLEESGTRPDLIVLSGDLADGGSEVSYRLLRSLIDPVAERLGCLVCYVPGNHDDRAAFRVALLGAARSIEPIDQVITVNGWRIVALDTTVPGSDHGEIDLDRLAWLADLLKVPAEKGTVLVLHHPPVPSPIELMTRIALREPEKLAASLCGSDVVAILCGHYHHPLAGLLGSVPVFVTSATSYQADVFVPTGVFNGLPGISFNRVDLVAGHALATTVVGVDERLDVFKTVRSGDIGLS